MTAPGRDGASADYAALSFDLIARAEDARSARDVEGVAQRAAQELAVQVCVGLVLRTLGPHAGLQVTFGCAPDTWRRDYCEAGHLAADPLMAHALARLEPASWADLELRRELQDAVAAARTAAGALALKEALVAPTGRAAGAVTAVLFMGEVVDAQAREVRHTCIAIAAALQRAHDRTRLAEDRSSDLPRLSRREVETLYWVSRSLSDKAIARTMALSPDTVTGYVRSAQRKLGARGRHEAAQRSFELGLLSLGSASSPPLRTAPPSRS